jgi:hypothetical protein
MTRGHARQFLVSFAVAAAFLLYRGTAFAEPLLELPSFDSLANKASESVVITLDSKLLGLAARFLNEDDADDAAIRDVVKGLQGIYVRCYKFDDPFAYPQADVDGVRKQLGGPGWQKLVEVRSRKEQTAVDIYISISGNTANGLALIASEPRQFTIVNIVGAIDLDKLHKLEGHFGVPELELETARKPVK